VSTIFDMRLRILTVLISLLLGLVAHPSNAQDYSCLRSPEKLTEDPIWTTSSAKNLRFVVSWAFKDPENCIVGMYGKGEPFGNNSFRWDYPMPNYFEFPASWTVTRAGEMTLISAETEFPIPLLQALPNRNLNGYGLELSQLSQRYDVYTAVKTRVGSDFSHSTVDGKYGLAQLWGNWFSKNQGIFPDQCKPISPSYDMTKLNSKISWKVLNAGPKPTVEISIEEDSNCIFLVHAGPLTKSLDLTAYKGQLSLAERPFWSGEAPPYFNQILSKPDQIVQVAVGDFTDKARASSAGIDNSDTDIVRALPSKILSHNDSVTRDGQTVKVTTTIDGTGISSDSSDVITIYTGFYWWYSKNSSYVPSGWRITYSGNSWTARYSSGGSLPGGVFMGYTTRAIKIPISDLLITPQQKAAADAKAAADMIKAAAAYKAIADAEIAKFEAELKAKQEAEVAAELKAKQEAEAKAAELKAKQEAAAKLAATKKATITCVKGKLTKKVTAVKPKCPTGYKLKK
jgi:hypothetical protein